MTNPAVPELRAVQVGLDQFGREVRSQLSQRPLTIDDGRRLIHAMTFIVNAGYAVTRSQTARRIAAERGATEQFEALAAACTRELQHAIAAISPLGDSSPLPDVETAVAQCYDSAQPVLRAAAQLVKRLKPDPEE